MNVNEFMDEVSKLKLNVRVSDLNKAILSIYTYKELSEKVELTVDEMYKSEENFIPYRDHIPGISYTLRDEDNTKDYLEYYELDEKEISLYIDNVNSNIENIMEMYPEIVNEEIKKEAYEMSKEFAKELKENELSEEISLIMSEAITNHYRSSIDSDKLANILGENLDYNYEDVNYKLLEIWNNTFGSHEISYFIDPQYLFNTIIKFIKIGCSGLQLLNNAFKHYGDLLLYLEDGYVTSADIIENRMNIFEGIDLSVFEEDKLNELILLINKLDSGNFNEIVQIFAKNNEELGKNSTPSYISKLITEIVSIEKKDEKYMNVYDPAMGVGSLLVSIFQKYCDKNPIIKNYANQRWSNCYIHGIEYDRTAYYQAKMNIVTNVYNESDLDSLLDENYKKHYLGIQQGDSISKNYTDDWVFNVIVSELPFNSTHELTSSDILSDSRYSYVIPRKTRPEFLFIQDMISKMSKNDGLIVTVVPPSFLFVGGEERNIRKQIIESNLIDTIIKLPKNSLFYTDVTPVILVLKKYERYDENTGKEKDILLIDASNNYQKDGKFNVLNKNEIKRILKTYDERQNSENYSCNVSLEEIRDNRYSLNFNRYIGEYNTEIIEINQARKNLKRIEEKISTNTKEIRKCFDKYEMESPL